MVSFIGIAAMAAFGLTLLLITSNTVESAPKHNSAAPRSATPSGNVRNGQQGNTASSNSKSRATQTAQTQSRHGIAQPQGRPGVASGKSKPGTAPTPSKNNQAPPSKTNRDNNIPKDELPFAGVNSESKKEMKLKKGRQSPEYDDRRGRSQSVGDDFDSRPGMAQTQAPNKKSHTNDIPKDALPFADVNDKSIRKMRQDKGRQTPDYDRPDGSQRTRSQSFGATASDRYGNGNGRSSSSSSTYPGLGRIDTTTRGRQNVPNPDGFHDENSQHMDDHNDDDDNEEEKFDEDHF